jgi:hypothetical protein
VPTIEAASDKGEVGGFFYRATNIWILHIIRGLLVLRDTFEAARLHL